MLTLFFLMLSFYPARHEKTPPPSPPPVDTSMTVYQALSTIKSVLQTEDRSDSDYCINRQPLQQIVVNSKGFQYLDVGTEDHGFWKVPYSITVVFHFQGTPLLVWQPLKHGGHEIANWPKQMQFMPALDRWTGSCVGGVRSPQVNDFFAAVNRMIWDNSPDGAAARVAAQAAFAQQAAAWRAMAVKPPMPNAAHVHQVLAENAVQEKNGPKAIAEFEAALAIFPTWPNGQFNLALLYGEAGQYVDAIDHMDDYLALVPDAPDAQASRDRIIIWQDKVQNPN